MIEISYLEFEGFKVNKYETPEEALLFIQDLEETDVFINHVLVSPADLSAQLLASADHILIGSKLIGA